MVIKLRVKKPQPPVVTGSALPTMVLSSPKDPRLPAISPPTLQTTGVNYYNYSPSGEPKQPSGTLTNTGVRPNWTCPIKQPIGTEQHLPASTDI